MKLEPGYWYEVVVVKYTMYLNGFDNYSSRVLIPWNDKSGKTQLKKIGEKCGRNVKTRMSSYFIMLSVMQGDFFWIWVSK